MAGAAPLVDAAAPLPWPLLLAARWRSAAVTLPASPLPATAARSTPISRARRRTAGLASTRAAEVSAGAAAAVARGGAGRMRPASGEVLRVGSPWTSRAGGVSSWAWAAASEGRVSGEASAAWAPFFEGAGFASAFGAGACACLGAGAVSALGSALAAPAPPASMTIMVWPTSTTSPSLPLISATVPATGEGMETVALSVMISTSG